MSDLYKGFPTFQARSGADWCNWLDKHHEKERSVWLIIFKKDSGIPSVYNDETVDEALCFGWADSKINKRHAQSYYQYFAARNPKCNWSRINKRKIEHLLAENRMAPAGLRVIEQAKASGTWDALNDVENLIIPEDLGDALDARPRARQHFEAFPRSIKVGNLEWIFNTKLPSTRAKRIEETARLAQDNIRANQ